MFPIAAKSCVDTEGFLDGENDGPYQDEENTSEIDADIIWKLDMIDELTFSAQFGCWQSVDRRLYLFTVTETGWMSHILLPSPAAAELFGGQQKHRA
ncbi:MAG: hypothetical protein R3C26_16975 [Calditrichia bacterium]